MLLKIPLFDHLVVSGDNIAVIMLCVVYGREFTVTEHRVLIYILTGTLILRSAFF